MNRRKFLTHAASVAAASALLPRAFATESRPIVSMPRGKAEHGIFIWLGGGMSQIDTFDPKRRGNPRATPKVAGSDYAAIDTAVKGVQFTEHLPELAKLAEKLTAVRTVNHNLGSEHALATNFVHTARAVSGSTMRKKVLTGPAPRSSGMPSPVPRRAGASRRG
ncbi:MAG TPA: DUF1501 domain-containing protein [Opitutaceae bacterium]|nr:DUF1501 domain-containing protein [Opitutaceae bacterium]